ncbi:MAG: carbon-nitrogen hydrolase family protein, partial [Acidimicrobiia bacterium]
HEWLEGGTENFGSILKMAERSRIDFLPSDVVVVPELAGAELSRGNYLKSVRGVARSLGSWVVGGSHHHRRNSRTINCGVVVDPAGSVVAEYEKLNPYGIEGAFGVSRGELTGSFDLNGSKVLVLLCADFWFSANFAQAQALPDLVLVPTFSITQRTSPRPAKSLWKHMAISRSYEFAAYVGISDWAMSCTYHGQKSSGVAGLANPRPKDGRGFFEAMSSKRIALFTMDFARLHSLRENRRDRGFLAPDLSRKATGR